MERQAITHPAVSRAITVLAVLLSVVGLAHLTFTLTPAALRAQPELLLLAAQQPDRMIDVIVQKALPAESVEQRVAALGGQVTKDLSLIHAIAARLPAAALPELARSVGVRWLSLDAPLVRTD